MELKDTVAIVTGGARGIGRTARWPPVHLCTDNAAMVAAAGAFRLTSGETAGLDLNADPRLPLKNLATTWPSQTRQQAP